MATRVSLVRGETLAEIDSKVSEAQAAAANAQSSALTCATWAVLSTLTGSTEGEGAEVLDSDTGTHTDPVVGSTVANAGRYTWSASPAGWLRIGATGLVGKATLRQARTAGIKSGFVLPLTDANLAVTTSWVGATPTPGVYTVAVSGAALRFTNPATSWTTTFISDLAIDSTVGADTFEISATLVSKDAGNSAWIGFSFGPLGSTRRHVVFQSTGAVTVFNDSNSVMDRPINSASLACVATNSIKLRVTRHDDGSADILATGPTGVLVSGTMTAGSLASGPVSIAHKGISVFDVTRLETWGESTDLTAQLAAKENTAAALAKSARLGGAMSLTDTTATTQRGDGATTAHVLTAETGGLQSVPASTAFTYLSFVETGFIKASGGRDSYTINAKFTAEELTTTALTFAVGAMGASRRSLCWSRQGAVQTRNDIDASQTVYANERSGTAWAVGDDLTMTVDYMPDGSIMATGYVEGVQKWSFDVSGGLLTSGPVWVGQRGVNTLLVTSLQAVGYPSLYQTDFLGDSPLVPHVAPVITAAAFSAAELVITASVDLQVLDETIKRTTVSGTVTLDATATGTVDDGSPQLVTMLTTAPRFPDHRHITSVVVKRVSDGVTLTSGVDYDVYSNSGSIFAKLENTPIAMTYAYTRERYDAVGFDMETRAFVVTKGTERDNDAGEYIPEYPAGSLPVCLVKVIGSAATIVETWRFNEGGTARGLDERLSLRTRNVTLMGPVFAKLATGADLAVMSYGDSITELTADLFTVRYPSDTQAAILADAGAYGDAGWGGRLTARLNAIWPGTITHINNGVSGSTSGSGTNNGSNSTRLSAAVAQAADLVLICFGRNDVLSSPENLRANLRTICAAFRAGGAVPVIISMPARKTGLTSQVEIEAAMTRRARMAAMEEKVPFVDLSFSGAWPYFAPVVGLVRADFAGCDLSVHPGWRELRIYAEEVIYQLAL